MSKEKTQKRILSGIQPSGILHIGNYLGAIQQWVRLQNDYESFFCVVDEHAITVPQDPEELRKNTLGVAMAYIAAGIDPKKSVIFIQSHVPAHTELGWILNTITPLGELEFMTQFKDKAHIKENSIEMALEHYKNSNELREKRVEHLKREIEAYKKLVQEKKPDALVMIEFKKDEIDLLEKIDEEESVIIDTLFDLLENRSKTNVGLLNYPVLMAADILLYQTYAVPVGDDQSQHVELTRSIAKRFNNRFGEVFKIPELMLQKETARIMGLDDAAKKMSKSAPSSANYIALLDSPEEIRKKIKSAVTDSGKEVTYDEKEKPAVANLLRIFAAFSDMPIQTIEKNYSDKGYAEFKNDLAELLVEKLSPFQNEYHRLEKDKEEVLKILRQGAEKANEVANKTLQQAKEKIGFIL